MFLLSPAKILVVLVVAVVVLGPDKLPKVARQLGALWNTFQGFRQRMESEVRDTFPDLPSSDTITQAIRSPLTLLDTLGAQPAGSHAAVDGGSGHTGIAPPGGAATGGAPSDVGIRPDGGAVNGMAPAGSDAHRPGGPAEADWLRSLQSLGVDASELN